MWIIVLCRIDRNKIHLPTPTVLYRVGVDYGTLFIVVLIGIDFIYHFPRCYHGSVWIMVLCLIDRSRIPLPFPTVLYWVSVNYVSLLIARCIIPLLLL